MRGSSCGISRKTGPFVALNCAALPEQLLESELFGYDRGAFTSAQQSKPGQLELASGGVLFLDEVTEMSLAAQAKFLRVLQEREFQRLGGTRLQKANIRVLRNQPHLRKESGGEFRETCTTALGVFDIDIPGCANARRIVRDRELSAGISVQGRTGWLTARRERRFALRLEATCGARNVLEWPRFFPRPLGPRPHAAIRGGGDCATTDDLGVRHGPRLPGLQSAGETKRKRRGDWGSPARSFMADFPANTNPRPPARSADALPVFRR